MTELLHMKDCYLQEFEGTITEIGANFVVLDRTAFYPEGGGQSGDRGVLLYADQEVKVVDTKKEKGIVRHILNKSPPFKVGMTIKGQIDWGWRYSCMRYHTAQHVLSRYLQIHHGLETVGNMIKPDRSRADFYPIDHFSPEMKQEIQENVNEILGKNLEVKIQFMPREEAIAFLEEQEYQVRYLRMVPASVKEFRIVTIGDFDAAACAGTHVRNTSEIGSIQLGKTKNVGAKKQRLYFTLTPTTS